MLNLSKIFKPNLGKFNPGLLVEHLDDPDIAFAVGNASQPEYLYFEDLKNIPEGMEKEKFWALIKLSRRFASKPIPPLNFNERNFMLNSLFAHNELFYKITNGTYIQNTGSNNLLEEAICSASIEDKSIKYLTVRRCILENTIPKNDAEKLAKQTYKLHERLLKADKLVKEMLIEDRIRTEDERFVYSYTDPELISYIAPRADIFEREFGRLLAFANDEMPHEFIHPIAKAIILHFWVLILSPLPTQSGILARAVQYWYLHKHGQNALLQLPLSKYIKSDLVNYSKVITCAAQDDNDITYFVDFIIRKIEKAKSAMAEVENKAGDFEKNILPAIQQNQSLNARQAKLVYELSKAKSNRTNFSAYMSSNNISRKTAADDLKKLEREGYLKNNKIGKNIFYYAGAKVTELFR